MATDPKAPAHIHLSIRRWRDKTYGNSYFSAQIIIDGVLAHVLPFQYGYGSHPEWEAGALVFGKGNLESVCRERGILFTSDDATVLKRECTAHGNAKPKTTSIGA